MITIDGKNIMDYTAILLEDSCKELVEYPKLKKVDSNDWAEHDGLEVDLESPRLDKKEITLSLYFRDKQQFEVLTQYLLATTYRIWNFTELGKDYKLRLKAFSGLKVTFDCCEVKVQLVDDFPLRNYTYVAPNLIQSDYGYSLDNINFSKYGIIPLRGSRDGLDSGESTKSILEIENRIMQGVKVAEQSLKIKGRNAHINCFMKLPVAEFWKGYNTFLCDLTKPNERTIIAHGKSYKCHYDSAKVNEMIVDNGFVWCEFQLNVVML